MANTIHDYNSSQLGFPMEKFVGLVSRRDELFALTDSGKLFRIVFDEHNSPSHYSEVLELCPH